MQFVLNTSFKPHFCLLLKDDGTLIEQAHWDTPKEDGQRVWTFLKTYLQPNVKLSFIGGVSGPGGFSSLRAGGAILNALAVRYNLPIHQARADEVLTDYLATQNLAPCHLVLNSFGSRIFTVEAEVITPVEVQHHNLDSDKPTVTSWLPIEKAAIFKNTLTVDPLGPQTTIWQTLKRTTPQTHFIPDYEYPAVQN